MKIKIKQSKLTDMIYHTKLEHKIGTSRANYADGFVTFDHSFVYLSWIVTDH